MPPNYTSPAALSQLPPKRRSWLLPFVIAVVLLLGSLGFGLWAYSQMGDYKNKSDQKSAAAVTAAEAVLDAKKEADFAEREKNPLKEYQGSSALGSVHIKYPRTWSAYVVESDRATTPLDAYLHPNYVPGVASGAAFALRFQIINSTYDQELQKFENSVRTGDVTVTPIAAANVSGVTGSRITGEVVRDKQGVTVLFPVRDKTLILTTESTDFVADFDSIVLANLKFAP